MHPNFVLASDRNCVPIILPIPSVEPRFISPLYRFHTQNGGGKTRAHRIFTPRNCTKLCADRIICSHASHSIRTPFIEITLHSLRICTLYSQKSHCILLEFAPPSHRNHVAFSQNFHHPFVEITLHSFKICTTHSQKSHCILFEFAPSLIEITLPSLRICTTLSQKSRCILLEFAPPSHRNHIAFSQNLPHPFVEITLHSLRISSIIRRNHTAFSQNLHPLFVEIMLCTRIICIIQLYIVATIFVQLRCHRI